MFGIITNKPADNKKNHEGLALLPNIIYENLAVGWIRNDLREGFYKYPKRKRKSCLLPQNFAKMLKF